MAETKKKPKNKGGRPRTEIDYKTLTGLCRIQCTGEECASVLGIDYDTLNRRLKQDGHGGFTDYLKRHSMAGKASLRRMQFRSAEGGSIPMQIWLGKQYLGQSEQNHNLFDLSDSLRELAENLPD